MSHMLVALLPNNLCQSAQAGVASVCASEITRAPELLPLNRPAGSWSCCPNVGGCRDHQLFEGHRRASRKWRRYHGHLASIGKCVATATDDVQCLCMLVRREGKTLDALLRRLDATIVDAYEYEHFTHEVNAPNPPGIAWATTLSC